jgi:hypothetical protein
LHLERGGDGAEAMVAIEPAGDRVAGKGDDAAVMSSDGLGQRAQEPVEPGREFPGTMCGPSASSIDSASG